MESTGVYPSATSSGRLLVTHISGRSGREPPLAASILKNRCAISGGRYHAIRLEDFRYLLQNASSEEVVMVTFDDGHKGSCSTRIPCSRSWLHRRAFIQSDQIARVQRERASWPELRELMKDNVEVQPHSRRTATCAAPPAIRVGGLGYARECRRSSDLPSRCSGLSSAARQECRGMRIPTGSGIDMLRSVKKYGMGRDSRSAERPMPRSSPCSRSPESGLRRVDAGAIQEEPEHLSAGAILPGSSRERGPSASSSSGPCRFASNGRRATTPSQRSSSHRGLLREALDESKTLSPDLPTPRAGEAQPTRESHRERVAARVQRG